MRNLLASIVLLVAIIVLYEATIGGDGADSRVESRASRLHEQIGGIDP